MPPDAATLLQGRPPASDPGLPTLAAALDPERAQAALARLPALADAGPLTAIRVVRHKPGRRCLVAYELEGYGTVYGKVQRRRYGKSGHRLLTELRAAGFDGADDGIAVPEPVGVIGELRMWLQREAPGRPATEAVAEPGAQRLARRIAAAAHKLHAAGVPSERVHTAGDEVRILHESLPHVAAEAPSLERRIARLLESCRRAAASLGPAPGCGIHRDFYSDQVLVDGERLTLVDFDLYCIGDPALDIGNYLGHVAEQALREHGSETALEPFEQALSEEYARRAGVRACSRARTWADLTLARHVYLSTRFPERRHLTSRLLDVAERRLAGGPA